MSEIMSDVGTASYPNGLPAPGRDGILALEAAMAALPAEMQIDPTLGLTHYFAPGLYARRLDRKAGTTIVGKIHKHDNLAMVLYGEMTIVDEDGSRRVIGPHVFVSKAGTKRATYAHTDAAFIVFHPTSETDVDKIEEEVIASSFEAFDEFRRDKLCHG